MTEPAIAEHDVTVFLGDVRERLAELAARSVQCVVTSPPYYGLRDYGVDGQLGLEASPGEYVAAMRAVFADVRRVLAGDGVLWLNLGDSYSASRTYQVDQTKVQRSGISRPYNTLEDRPAKNMLGIPWRVAAALQDDGWTLRNAVIWHKPNAMPESVTDRLSTRYEHVFLFSKSRRYWFDLDPIREPIEYGECRGERDPITAADATNYAPGMRPQTGRHRTGNRRKYIGSDLGRNPGDVWTVATSPFAGAHFATMPPELARRCILAGCPEDGTVLDPFTGSGTTAMVARQFGRKFVGIELNPDYLPIIRQRIGQEPFDFDEATA